MNMSAHVLLNLLNELRISNNLSCDIKITLELHFR